MMRKYLLLLISLTFIISCATKNKQEVKKPLGATRAQETRQMGLDNISNPAMPATQLPPPGTPTVIPPVQP